MTTITTTYKTNATGAGKILAKGFGRQKTVAYNHEASAPRNHGEAAAALILANPENPFSTGILAGGFESVTHEDTGEGVHYFRV